MPNDNLSTNMKKILLHLFLVVAISATLAAQETFQPTWKSLNMYDIPNWYRDAKFGIFIHWGVYSVPAFSSEWYPRNMYERGSEVYKHHIATYGTQDKFGY